MGKKRWTLFLLYRWVIQEKLNNSHSAEVRLEAQQHAVSYPLEHFTKACEGETRHKALLPTPQVPPTIGGVRTLLQFLFPASSLTLLFTLLIPTLPSLT